MLMFFSSFLYLKNISSLKLWNSETHYSNGKPAVDVSLVGNVEDMVDVGHDVRCEVGKRVRVVEHDGDGDLGGYYHDHSHCHFYRYCYGHCHCH